MRERCSDFLLGLGNITPYCFKIGCTHLLTSAEYHDTFMPQPHAMCSRPQCTAVEKHTEIKSPRKYNSKKTTMTKTTTIVAALGLCMFTASVSTAQGSQKDEIQLIQSAYGIEKREIVKEYIKLSDADAQKFWATYDEYEAERQKLGKDRINILSEYAMSYDTLKDAQADRLAMRTFDNELEFDKLHKKYYGKVKKDLGALKAAAFFQLESYLQTTVLYELQDNIPFIGELDKKKKK
jgi:hypothetical protein